MPPTSKKSTTAEATADRYAPTAWQSEYLEDLTVPSGQLCQVRRPGLQGLIREGILDKMDVLTALVNDKHVERVKKGKRPNRVAEITDDPIKLVEVLGSVDKVVAHIVVQPTVVRPVVIEEDDNGDPVERPMADDERKPGTIYTDMLDVEDKMFLFNYAVGGTRDIERFRRESRTAVGSVDALEAVEDETK